MSKFRHIFYFAHSNIGSIVVEQSKRTNWSIMYTVRMHKAIRVTNAPQPDANTQSVVN